jgi:hypothetical protein
MHVPPANRRVVSPLAGILATVLVLAAVATVFSASPAHAQPQVSNIDVSTANNTGGHIYGYDITLWQNGQVINSCYSTCDLTFDNGVQYQIAAADYGNECFSEWASGSYVSTNEFYDVYVANGTGSAALQIAAVYVPCSGSGSPGTSEVTIASEDTSGSTISGYYVILYNSSGAVVDSGYTLTTFPTTSGQLYSIRADSYGSCTFSDWAGGGSNNPMTFTAPASDQTFTAVYQCGSSSGSGSSVAVSSVDQNGNMITGYYTLLYDSSGSVQTTGYTPSTFATTAGSAYSIQADSYASCTFTGWSNGVTTNPMSFTATSSTQKFTAVYNCG